MHDDGREPLGRLLWRYRQIAGLTQEALAERSGVSERAIRGLERGDGRRARPSTIRLLADALHLTPPERAAFQAAALRGRVPAGAVRPYLDTALPVVPTELVGRDREVADVLALLRRPATRLVTLTGPAGVGKTRLGIRVASDLRDEADDGVLYVPLSPLSEPVLVMMAIAHALGLQEDGARPLIELVTAALRDLRLLLVLDTFEHLLDAAPTIADLLGMCPSVRLLVTSRAPLRLRGEIVYQVPPLALPDSSGGDSVASLATVPAVALFLQRAADALPDFALTTENAAAVAAICARLDGLPLALELAAPRLKLLPPRALLAQLERSLPLLTGGARDLPDRQRTMRDAVAWSYNLLRPVEQAVFRRLCVFAAGLSLEAADAAMLAPHPLPVSGLEGLASLVDNSLARRYEGAGGRPRFAILQVLRDYGLERLVEAGEEAALRRAHADYFAGWSERVATGLLESDGAWRVALLEEEHDNLRMALYWSIERGDVEIALRLGAALWPFWRACSYLDEGHYWLGRVLARGATGSPSLRERVLEGLAALSR